MGRFANIAGNGAIFDAILSSNLLRLNDWSL